ncbi:MAG: hypothetical protein IJI25_08275 [Eubacterium sp.]|nr:hypothetical protein [Eubacterium sp.]
MKKLVMIMMLAAAVCLAGCGGNDSESKAPASGGPDTEKSEGVMTHEEFMNALVGDEVVIEAYVQAHQAWWDDNGQGKVTIYLQDADGGYFAYEVKADKEEAEALQPGTKVKVTGVKTEWSGEIEIAEDEMGNGPTVETEEGSYIAEALDVTDLLGTDDLISHQNEFVAFKGMTVEANDDGSAFLYNYDGSGSQGDDLYFKASVGGQTYTFTVESYLTGSDTDVYKAVEALKAGDVIDMEGFLYWYEGANPHITSVKTSE